MNASRKVPTFLLSALAFPGLVSVAAAYSPGVASGSGCNACHSGGVVPAVNLSGATTLDRGTSIPITLTITGGAAVRGGLNARINVASSTAFLSESSAAMQIIIGSGGLGEVTHSSATLFSMNTLSYTFQLNASATAACDSTVFMTAWGLSANGANAEMGDRAAVATQMYTITCPPEDIFENGFE